MEESKAPGGAAGGVGGQELNEQQIIGTYRGMLGDVNQMRRKISELEQEVSEHQMVVDTLEPLEGTRRAYRLVGGVLVERTVGEVLPTVKANQEGIKQLLQQLATTRANKEKEAAEWKIKYKIRSQQEAQAMSQAQGVPTPQALQA
ncbi:unnamed protein product [Ectocarpus sp. 8 AP-2014]